MTQSNLSFQQLVENVPIGIFHCDSQGTITYANRYWLSLFALTADQLEESSWLNAIAPHERHGFALQWQTCIRSHSEFECEVPLHNNQNGERYICIRTQPIMDNKNQCVGFVGHASDITSRAQAEKALKDSRELSRALIEQSSVPCAIKERDGYIHYINPAFSHLFGYLLEDIQTPDSWYRLAYPNTEYRQKIKQGWQQYIENIDEPANKTIFEAHITCKDGNVKTILASASKLGDSESEQLLINFHDISELKLAQESLEKSQERFALAVKGSGVGIWDWNIESGHVFFAAEFKKELGYSDSELSNTARSFYRYLHPDDVKKVQQAFNDHLSKKNTPYFIKYRMRHKDGSYHWYQGVGQSLKDKNGHAYRMSGSHTNISAQMENHERLVLAKMVFDHSGEAIMTTDRNGFIQATNAAFTLITGFEQDEVIKTNVIHLGSKKNTKETIANVLQQLQKVGTWSGEIWCKKKKKSPIAVTVMITAIKDDKGNTQRFIALFTDVTEKKKNQEIIWQQAHYDDLTQLLNRHSFAKYINSAINSKQPFALLFIDLDHFKQVNDTLGHKVGDELLKQAAHRIKHCVRTSDIVSRFGGDEFTVVLSGLLDEKIINRICDQIIKSLSTPYDLHGEAAYISASIGVTQYPNDSHDVEELYKYADQAMYDAKRNGRNRYAFFTQELQIAANKHREITSDLRNALNNNEFEILYQPIINLNSNHIYKAEALLRWNHPERGQISPNEFIPIAEETGLINEIGDWVFKQAALQVKILRHYAKDFQVSINKSPIQFYSDYDEGHAKWSHFLTTINLQGSAIAVEITEGLLLDSTAMVKEKLVDFQKYGMSISLDDFGTGYSALSYLNRFDINYIKIDKSFVMNLEKDSYNQILCETIISMSHKLGMKVIAEGIETQHQKQILINAGCDYGQGYLFSRPTTSDRLIEIIKQSNH